MGRAGGGPRLLQKRAERAARQSYAKQDCAIFSPPPDPSRPTRKQSKLAHLVLAAVLRHQGLLLGLQGVDFELPIDVLRIRADKQRRQQQVRSRSKQHRRGKQPTAAAAQRSSNQQQAASGGQRRAASHSSKQRRRSGSEEASRRQEQPARSKIATRSSGRKQQR